MVSLLTSGGVGARCYHKNYSPLLHIIVTAYEGTSQLEGYETIKQALTPSLPHIYRLSRANWSGWVHFFCITMSVDIVGYQMIFRDRYRSISHLLVDITFHFTPKQEST